MEDFFDSCMANKPINKMPCLPQPSIYANPNRISPWFRPSQYDQYKDILWQNTTRLFALLSEARSEHRQHLISSLCRNIPPDIINKAFGLAINTAKAALRRPPSTGIYI